MVLSSLSSSQSEASTIEPKNWKPSLEHLTLNSTLADLSLFDCSVAASLRGAELCVLFDQMPLLPGAVLMRDRETVGIISRRSFFKQMSKQYGVDLFSQRPIEELLDYARAPMLVLPIEASIVSAARASLARPPKSLYEPIVVDSGAIHDDRDRGNRYYLVDVHQLLIAQSRIHELTKQLLEQQTKAHAIQTEKMASLGRSIAGIAHEIRNPVNCIHGNMQFLETYVGDLNQLIDLYSQGADIEEIEDFKADIEFDFLRDDLLSILQTLKVSSGRMRDIVESLRSFARVGTGKRQPFSIHTCLDSSLLILNSRFKAGVTLEKQYGELALESIGYSGQIGQVFLNLISNALDALCYSDPPVLNPTVTIATEQDDDGSVIVKIRDNGPGIPENIRTRIFEDFFTTKSAEIGTGMGLAIVHQIVTENHGGRITFRTDAAWGTEFEVRLPGVL
jgi:two-component system, NtrC family, sensor kinase